MAIDSHMHINNKILTNTDFYINKINESKLIDNVINVGLDIETSKESILISNNNSKFYSSVGIHPLYINGQNCEDLYNLIDERTVAIGEIGLDNSNSDYIDQKKIFIKQIMITNELKLPVIIHANNTNKEVIEIFKNYIKPKYGCVFHCFQPDIDSLKYIIENGYYISFAGRITYKTAKKSIEVAKIVPNDLFLIETDSPYIAPVPIQNSINESENIKYIIDKLSEIKQLSFEQIEEITSTNTKRLFKKIK